MRKLLGILGLAILMSMCSFQTAGYADPIKVGDVAAKLPPLKQGLAYSLVDSKLNYLSTIEVANWKEKVSLEAGYAGAADETGHKIVGVVSFDLLQLKDINVPILKYVKFRPGVYVGFGGINVQRIMESELDWGVSATLLEVTF